MSAHIRYCRWCQGLHVTARHISVGCRLLIWPTGRVRLSPDQEQIMRRLLLRERSSTAELIEWLWGPEPDGGPLAADNTLNVQLCRLRAKLADAGAPFEIEWASRLGYRLVLREQIGAAA